MVISYIGTFLIGTLGTAYLLPKLLSGAAAERVFSETMLKMYTAFIAGIFHCAILAASMSTADSQLLSAASAVSRDFFKGIVKKDADEKAVLNVGRITVFAIAAVAFFLSLNPESSIFGLVSYAWAGFGATFGPAILFALFWKRSNRQGILAGLVAGGVMVFVWKFCVRPIGGVWNVYELLPAFIVASAAIVVVSMLTPKPSADIEKIFDEVNAN